MNDADLRQLRRELAALQPGTPRRFLYCAAGPEGAPVFRIARRIPPGEVTTLLRFARDRRIVQGRIQVVPSGKLRLIATGADDAMLDRIADFFAEPIPMLTREKLTARTA